MNNLKKVLALGLALVMLLGMFTIASAEEAKVATALTDWDSIEHQSAVALNVDLGIIKGMPDGSYSPAENIDRASWAKLVYVTACGDEDADAYLGTVSALKDVAGNWAESYINYLAANKYISGNTDGNYMPSNNVTVVEACKTMLTVLGYDAKDRGYENNEAWSGLIMSDAKERGLMKDVDQTAMQPLTRDNAAQIIYNALQARMVEKNKGRDNGEFYVSSYDDKGTLGYKVFDLVKLTGVVTEVTPEGKALFDNGVIVEHDKTTEVIGTGIFSGYVNGTLADVGQFCEVFVKADATYDNVNGWFTSVVPTELVSTNVSRTNKTPVKTITKGVDFRNNGKTANGDHAANSVWNKANTEYYVGAQPEDNLNDIDYYVNGALQTAPVNVRKGSVAELYDANDNGKVDTIKILEYSVAELNADVRTKTENGVEKIYIASKPTSVTKGKYVPVDQISGDWKSLKNGDVVLFYDNGLTGDDMVLGIEKADSVTGKVTSASGKGVLTIAGKTYDFSEITNAGYTKHTEADHVNWGDYDNEFTFYLDKNKGVCYSVQNTDETVSGNVAIILGCKWTDDGAVSASYSLKADLLLLDGSTERNVTISRVGVNEGGIISMKTVVAEIKSANNASTQIVFDDIDQAGIVEGDYTDGFFSYRVDADGYYELTNLSLREDDYAAAIELAAQDTGADGIEKRPTFDNNGHNATSKTIFLVEKDIGDGKPTYTAVTGYANVPAIAKASFGGGVMIQEKDTDGSVITAAKYVFLKADAFADDAPEGFIFLRSTTGDRDSKGNYTLKIVDAQGNETSALFEGSARQMGMDSSTDDQLKLQLFAITSKTDGIIRSVTNIGEVDDPSVHYDELGYIGDGVVTVGNVSYEYDEKTVMVQIDLREDPENLNAGKWAYDNAGALDPDGLDTDSVVFEKIMVGVIEDDGLCDYVYVIRYPRLTQNQEA